jgi:hypothetical protein
MNNTFSNCDIYLISTDASRLSLRSVALMALVDYTLRAMASLVQGQFSGRLDSLSGHCNVRMHLSLCAKSCKSAHNWRPPTDAAHSLQR